MSKSLGKIFHSSKYGKVDVIKTKEKLEFIFESSTACYNFIEKDIENLLK